MKKLILILGLTLVYSASLLADSSFYYYTKEHRVQALRSLYSATKSIYSLWEIKLINMGIDGDKLFSEAIAAEEKIPDAEGPVAKATSNIKFHDRVIKLVASFQDTHFGAKANVPLPSILNGLKLGPVKEDGVLKAIVTAKSAKIMEYNQAIGGQQEYSKVYVGDEVVSIDGVKTSDLVKEFKKYIDGSSEGFRESAAIMALARRAYNYPEKNYSEWVFKSEHGGPYTVRLPWYVDKTDRRDAKVFFASRKFRMLEQLFYSWDQEKMTWIESNELLAEGYNRMDAPEGLLNETEWGAQYGDTELRTGYFIKNGKSYGYVQLFSFTSSSLRKKGEKEDSSQSINEIFRAFVKELSDNNTPLIFDLRVNFGGNSAIALENLSIIGKAGESYPSRTVAFRTTQFMQQLFNSPEFDPGLSETERFNDSELFINEFYHAVSINRSYTNVLLQSPPVTADPEVGGYSLPVVALTSPWCISACDNQAFLLKASKRVKLIGQPANGTGAGFRGSRHVGSNFVDPFFIISVRIPNYLFGLPIETDRRVITDNDGSILFETNSENKPTMPHEMFNYSRESYEQKGKDWIKKAIEAIESDNNLM